MHNILLVIKREYLSRVRKKSFLIMTIIGPLLFAAIMVVPVLLSDQAKDTQEILVLDESKKFESVFEDEEKIIYQYNLYQNPDEAKEAVKNGKFNGLLIIPDKSIDELSEASYYAMSNPSINALNRLERKLKNEIESQKLTRSGIDQEVLDQLKAHVIVSAYNISEEGNEKQGSPVGASIVGYVASFMIYMFIFIYGAMCMRGVIEEKSSRIIEIIVASVRPFHLMMGKVLGIASVGLSQLLLWITLTMCILLAGGLVFGQVATPQALEQIQQMEGQESTVENPMQPVFDVIESLNITQVIIAFVFFFISGYLFYGGLFAAVGSAVDSDADAQQFMLPVTIPLIFSIMLLGVVLNDPNGSLAFWLSMIPFFAPVVMMMRVAFGVPLWELLLSMTIMVAGIVFMIWFASRIYRVGILMHGTKVNYKVLAKWFMTNQ